MCVILRIYPNCFAEREKKTTTEKLDWIGCQLEQLQHSIFWAAAFLSVDCVPQGFSICSVKSLKRGGTLFFINSTVSKDGHGCPQLRKLIRIRSQ